VLDLPVHIGLDDNSQVGNNLTYCEAQAATEDDEAEHEQLVLVTNWD